MSLPNHLVPDRDEARRRQAEDPLLGSAASAADAAGLACPDAETLGLYAEGALSRAEATAIATHVQGCGRCEDVVATIARALPAAVAADDARAADGAGVAGWFRGWRWMVPALSLAGAAAVAFWLGRSPAPVPEMDLALASKEAGPAGAPAGVIAGADAAKDELAKQAAPPAVPVAQAPAVAAPSAPAAVSGRERADRAAAAGTPAATARLEAASPTTATLADEPTSRKSIAESVEARRKAAAPAESLAVPAAPAAAPVAVPAPLAARERAAEPAVVGNVAADAAKPAPPPAQSGAAGDAAPGGAAAGAAASGAGAADFRASFERWRVRNGRLEFARDGRAWRRVTLPTTERVARVTERPDGSVLVVSASGAEFVSSNLGATWQRQ